MFSLQDFYSVSSISIGTLMKVNNPVISSTSGQWTFSSGDRKSDIIIEGSRGLFVRPANLSRSKTQQQVQISQEQVFCVTLLELQDHLSIFLQLVFNKLWIFTCSPLGEKENCYCCVNSNPMSLCVGPQDRSFGGTHSSGSFSDFLYPVVISSTTLGWPVTGLIAS